MEELRDFIRFLLNAPSIWAASVALLNVLLPWQRPDMPPEVLLAINGLVVAVGAVISAYYTGKETERNASARQRKAAAAKLPRVSGTQLEAWREVEQ